MEIRAASRKGRIGPHAFDVDRAAIHHCNRHASLEFGRVNQKGRNWASGAETLPGL